MKNFSNNDLIPVEGQNNLFRDRTTGAIINSDKSGYLQYQRLNEQKKKEKEELKKIKDDIDEIKFLFKEFLNKSKWNYIRLYVQFPQMKKINKLYYKLHLKNQYAIKSLLNL